MVFLSPHLTWSYHIQHVKIKIAKSIGILCRARKVLKRTTLITLYSRTPLIRPPSESHWCGRIRGMVAHEGFGYTHNALSVTRNVVV